jgi:alcohol dehydrogenase class IV
MIFNSPQRIVYGFDCLNEDTFNSSKLNLTNLLVITDNNILNAGIIDNVTQYLPNSNISIFSDVPPEPALADLIHCSDFIQQGNFDCILAIGGGSVLDIAKASRIAAVSKKPILELFGEELVDTAGIPLIAMPTTAGTGSECTAIAIFGVDDMKKGIVSRFLLPELSIISPEMTLTCPANITAASGIDALVHAIESYTSNNATPVTDALAIKAITLITKSMKNAYTTPDNIIARDEMATGSMLAGLAFGSAGVGAVHALAYPLGGKYHLAHGVSNALLLPYVLKYNITLETLTKFTNIARVIGLPLPKVNSSDSDKLKQISTTLIDYVTELCQSVGIPRKISDLIENNIIDINYMTTEAMKVERLLRNNPYKLTQEDIKSIYLAAV